MQPMTPPVRTIINSEQALASCWQAHQNVIGGPLEDSLLAILVAQSALETGRWKAMWNFNAGNIRGFGPGGEWTSIHGASEIIDGKEVFPAFGPENRFASYPSAVSGFEGLVRFLGTSSHPPEPNRYAVAWQCARVGNVVGYCAALQAHGYFTANLASYTEGVRDQYSWLQRGPLPSFLSGLAPHEEAFPPPPIVPKIA